MTPDDLNILIQEGEGTTLEFKESLSSSFARELVALANTIGGKILLGVRDAEAVQHHEMVGRYLEDQGSISRRDVAELCGISDPQAHRLLKKMVSEGVLRRVGTWVRSVRYERNA